jgi:hypothetical protein
MVTRQAFSSEVFTNSRRETANLSYSSIKTQELPARAIGIVFNLSLYYFIYSDGTQGGHFSSLKTEKQFLLWCNNEFICTTNLSFCTVYLFAYLFIGF